MSVLNVSTIQRFSTGDGPGIRTTVFLKGCSLHCPWCHNPENISPARVDLFYEKAGKTVSYGKPMLPQEVAADVLEDREFYLAGGGGVTVSGGEPMLQPEGTAELAAILKKAGVKTLADTAGCVPWSHFEAVLDSINDFYFDIKTASPEKYREIIGGDLSLIENNLRKLVLSGAFVTARIPLIPGFNDREQDLMRIGEIIKSAGVRHADILPFHRLGIAKYEAMGFEYKYKDTLPPGKDAVRRAADIIGEYAETGIE
ncbi:MAG: radical SAM protein [Clostridia bacterium]|nr:radical SAM protein [Clostridia bacterium]